MRKFTKYFLTMAMILLSSSVMLAQLRVSSSGGKQPLLPESRAVLYEQSNSSGSTQASQDFETAYDVYDCQGADDFIVPAGIQWVIQTVTVTGSGSTGATLANVYIYADIGGMPAANATTSLMGLTCTNSAAVLTIPIPGNITLGPGHYWLSVQDASPYGSYGQWWWMRTLSIYNYESYWRNPGNGFGLGAITWTAMSTLGYLNSDFMFRLEGTSGAVPTCQYRIDLYDAFGDGWNGCTIDVLVGGVVVLDNITLSGGLGPLSYYFNVWTGAEITTTFAPASWVCEPYYYVYNSLGAQVYYVPPNCNPIIGSGLLYGACPTLGAVDGYVFNYDGLAIAGATIAAENGPTTTSQANGYYILTGINSGSTTMVCTKPGYNPAIDVVAVVAADTVTHNFTLTKPNMIVNPLYIEETLNPGEFFTTSLNVLNNGNGPLHWEAEIVYPETDQANGGGTVITTPPDYHPTSDNSLNGGNGVALGEDGNRDLMTCPETSIFAIPPVSSNNGYTSTAGLPYFCYQSFSGLTDPITQITFWGLYTSTPAASPTFLINICQPGSTPGAVVTTLTVAIPAVNTGVPVIGYPTYQFTVEVPSTELEAGWVGVQQQTTSPYFYWLNTMAGAGFPAYQVGAGAIPERLAICLAGGGGAGNNWLTMDYYEGDVPGFGGVDNIPTHLDAAGTQPGEVYTADVIFTSTPNVGTIDVPVTMIIMGNELVAPDDLTVTLTNDITGTVNVAWTWAGDAFQFFMVKRDGVIIGTTTSLYYNDILPTFGEYCYTVQAVYDEGQTSPAGPECVTWPNPSIFIDPDNLEAWVWVDNQVKVYTTIYNLGIGTLHYTFPDFAVSDNSPVTTINLPAGPANAPQNTAVASGAFKARPDGTYTLNAGNGSREGSTVLLVAADDAYTIQDLLLAYGDLGSVDYYDARYNTPSLNLLSGYDVVVTWSNYNYSSASSMGNVLADYVDAGGRVLNLMFALDPNWGLQGRFVNEGYSAMTGSGTNYSTGCLGSYDASHPIMAGVTNVCDYYRLANPSLTSGSSTVAQWTDGSIFVAVKDDQTVVSIGGYVGDSYNWSGQMPDVVHNAINWLAGGGGYFIVAVEPATANVPAGGSQLVEITYDATGFDPGTYTQELPGESNDPDHLEFVVNNTMHVYMPGQFAGYVHDNDNGDPIGGVTVTAGPFQTMTDDAGNYSMYVDEGSYNVVFQKLGYMPVTVSDTFALAGVVTPLSIGMWDANYAPGMVHAEVMANDTWCQVTWTLPDGPYEIVMDDGSANDYFIYSSAGSMNAVKFTPTGYPANIIGGQIYVGNGDFPGPFIGTSFSIAIYDDDGPNGLPGTRLDSNAVTVNNYGWVSFDWLNATIESGDFYLAMIQTAPSPFSAPIGVDTDNPTYFRSYSYFQGAPGWVLSPLQDFMIRAWVNGPEGDAMAMGANNNNNKVWRATPKVPAGWQKYAQTASGTLPKILPGYQRNDETFRGVESMSNRNVTNYRVARYSNFDPNGSPAAGTLTELATTANLQYNDNAWAGLPMGWYAYGVKALYTSGLYSNYTISNIVGHLMDYQVTVNVTLSTGLEPINCEITLQGLEYPYATFFAVTPASGTVVFDQVWRGHYDISAFKIGYDLYKINNTFVNNDKTYNIMLSEKKYPPTCLVVDPVSLIATWCEPLRTAIEQDFEDPTFPPAGWQVLTQGDGPGWERTDDGSSADWPIPSWDSFYAMCNDDAAGSNSDGCCDYLITPGMDLRESDGYALSFNSFYDGSFGELAFVEYSTDGGATWEVLNQMTPATAWSDIELDLSAFSGLAGPAQVWFAFHADDAGAWASGWAVDNVKVQVPTPAASYLDFWVFLDNAFEGVTTETTWDYAPLWYGQTYTASVAARYTSGLSAKDYYTFFCEYLFPPDSLHGDAPDDAAILIWLPPLEYWPVLAASDGPKYSKSVNEFTPGVLADANAINRREANDIPISVSGTRDVGDVLNSFPWPNGSLCWGVCDDGTGVWISDPNVSATTIYQLDYDGVSTGATIVINEGQSWVGDMVSDGEFLYGCLVGGSNAIVKVDLADGSTVGTITGDWAVTSQRGLAADFVNEEFYIGGWNSNQIWRSTFDGTTISTFGFSGVSGLAWHPNGGPDQAGSLWVVVNASSDMVTEVDPNNGWATVQSFVMPNDQGYSGAGMELKIGNPDAGALWICNQSDNTIYLVDSGEPLIVGPVAGLPDNLLGYNVYRDMEFVAYTPHVPVGEYVPQTYVDEGLQPGIYNYTVTAVYDLAPYGYPGETGESMHEGPWPITVDYCFTLDFTEDWSMGNFDNNNWLTDAANWGINGQQGNPMPAADFHWSPIQTNYEYNMESYPMCAAGMTEGKIWLDYDIKLNSYQSTGEEMMHVQIWNWDTKVWTSVADYSNADGSFNWTSEHINIKSQAMNKVFKVRFQAAGVNSINILDWFVDNIHIYRVCEGATGLTVDAIHNTQYGMKLDWTAPDQGLIDEWIHWDDGVNSGNSIGTGAAAQFDVAARWEPAQLADYEGAAVTEVAFFPAEANSNYNVRVWIGAGAANMVVDQPVAAPVIGQWNYVALTTPVPVDITQELWVGYYVDAQAGYPAGVDAGPAIDGYGNMINFGGWQTLLQVNPDLDFNWNIAAHLVTVTGVTMPLGKSVTPYQNGGMTLTANPTIESAHKVFAPGNGSRDLMGYNIYRSIDGAQYEMIDYTTEVTYLDTEAQPIIGGVYCYMVTAVWESETDQCESAFSNEACDIWTGIIDNQNADASTFSLYPNPANDHVFITTSGDLKRVTVYNALGQLVIDEITKGKEYELNTANYTIGVYMVKVETAAGTTTRTLTIQR